MSDIGWGSVRIIYRRVFWNFIWCNTTDPDTFCHLRGAKQIRGRLWWISHAKRYFEELSDRKTVDTIHYDPDSSG